MIEFSTDPVAKLIRGLPFADYCQIKGLNQSLLKTFSPDFRGCPATYKHRSSTPDTRDTDALREGRAFHSRLLEPKAFDAAYRVMTPADCQTIFENMQDLGLRKKSKAKYMDFSDFASWKASGPTFGFTTSTPYKEWMEGDSREVLSLDDAEMLSAMTAAIWENPDVATELEKATLEDCEVTALAPYKFHGGEQMQLKARFDIVTPDAIIDAKTCRSTNAEAFARDCEKYGYDIQAAFYLHVANAAGLKRERFGFLAQEKTAPYPNCIHWMPEDWLFYCRERFKTILADIADAIRSNAWPNPETGILEPPYRTQKILEAVA
jgi:hypothetical protein